MSWDPIRDLRVWQERLASPHPDAWIPPIDVYETADRYVRLTVLFATVLFLVAISQRFTYRAVRLAATSLAGALMILALIGVITLPRL